MTIDTFLKKLPDVLAVLTSEKTQERMSGIYNDVEDLTEIVMASTQDAAEDLTAILTDILLSLEVIEDTRSMRNPADVTRLKRIETMFQPAQDGIPACGKFEELNDDKIKLEWIDRALPYITIPEKARCRVDRLEFNYDLASYEVKLSFTSEDVDISKPRTVRDRLDEATAVLTSKELFLVIKKAEKIMKDREVSKIEPL